MFSLSLHSIRSVICLKYFLWYWWTVLFMNVFLFVWLYSRRDNNYAITFCAIMPQKTLKFTCTQLSTLFPCFLTFQSELNNALKGNSTQFQNEIFFIPVTCYRLKTAPTYRVVKLSCRIYSYLEMTLHFFILQLFFCDFNKLSIFFLELSTASSSMDQVFSIKLKLNKANKLMDVKIQANFWEDFWMVS